MFPTLFGELCYMYYIYVCIYRYQFQVTINAMGRSQSVKDDNRPSIVFNVYDIDNYDFIEFM